MNFALDDANLLQDNQCGYLESVEKYVQRIGVDVHVSVIHASTSTVVNDDKNAMRDEVRALERRFTKLYKFVEIVEFGVLCNLFVSVLVLLMTLVK